MSFQDSACQIEVVPSPEGSTSLVAICNNEEGSGLMSDIVLDEFLGNENGWCSSSLSLHLQLGNHFATQGISPGLDITLPRVPGASE